MGKQLTFSVREKYLILAITKAICYNNNKNHQIGTQNHEPRKEN